MEKEKLSDDQVKVQIARCPSCKGIVKMSIVHLMDMDCKFQFIELMEKRCEISQISLEEARLSDMCFLNCDEPLVVPRQVIIEKKNQRNKDVKKNV